MKRIIIRNGMRLFFDAQFNIFHGDKIHLWTGGLSYKNKKIKKQILLCTSLNTPFLVSNISGVGAVLIFDLQTGSVTCYSSVHNTEYILFFCRGKGIYFVIGIKKIINIIGKSRCNVNSIRGMLLSNHLFHDDRITLPDQYPGKSEHIKNIIESIYSIHPSRSISGIDIVAPILFENVILKFITIPSYEHFDSSLDRKLIRKIAAKKYNDVSLLNISKKSSSNIFFKIPNKKQKHIYDIVINKKLLQVIHMSEQKFKDMLYLQSNIRYIASDFLLIYKLYQMAIFLNLYDLDI